jgi:hypothetical protein
MSTDLEVSTGQSQVAVRSNEIVKKVSDLERGGYYKTVVSPEDYLAGKNREGSRTNDELELNDDSQSVIDTKDKQQEVSPLNHWNRKIQKKFEECTESQKKAWVDSFKIIEKGFVKQLNALKDDIMVAEPILAAISPYAEDIRKIGLTPEEYLRELIKFDYDLGNNPAKQVARLIAIHNLSYDSIYNQLGKVSQEVKDEESMSKYVDPLKKELTEIKSALGYSGTSRVNQAEAVQTAQEIVDKVTMFFEQRDSAGRELYPGAFARMEDILELVQTGENLEDAYNLVVNGGEKDEKVVEVEGGDVDYEEPQRSRRAEMTLQEKEKQMLLNTLKKITR